MVANAKTETEAGSKVDGTCGLQIWDMLKSQDGGRCR